MKASARFVSTVSRFGFGRSKVGRIATRSAPAGAQGTGARSGPIARAATLLASIALLLGVAAPAASAATATDSYGYLASFGTGVAQLLPAEFNAVAIDDSTGNILVSETVNGITGEGALQIYAPDPVAGGESLTTVLGFLPVDIAVDQSDGSLYVVDYGQNYAISRFLSDGAPVPTYTVDSSFVSPPGLLDTAAGGLAVDPVTHDVLASHRNTQRVYRLDQTGALLSSFDGSNTPAGAFETVGSLAVGPTGTAYVVDASRVERFNSAGASLGPLSISGGPSMIAVNPQSGEVAVVVSRQGQTYIEGFTAAGVPTFSSHIPPQAGGGAVGLAWDAGTDRIYLDTSNGIVHTFVPAKQPGLDPPAVSQITPTGAHLEAKVAPGGEAGETTKARIEYCPVTATCVNPGSWVRLTEHEGLSSGEVTIEDNLTELIPNSEYLVRVSADREAADHALTDNVSATTSFNTPLIPPEVHTGLAGAITTSEAQLTGTIATYGDQTTYHFEYGLTTNYGSSAPAGAEGVAGKERAARNFTRTLTGLQPGTEYHYRLVAHNSAGESIGEDRTFTTVGADQVAPGRGYEEVTPVDKRGAVINPYGFQAAADGSAIEYTARAPSTDVASAPITPRYISRRGSSDWLDWQPIDPPLNVTRQIVESVTLAVSADFNHALVVSNRVLAPGGIENGGNLYVTDLRTGAYTLVGAASGVSSYLNMASLDASANMYLMGAPDFSWVVFESVPRFLPGAPSRALYKWSEAGGLELESYLPDESVPADPVVLHDQRKLTTRAVSDDGNTMYFVLDAPESPGPDAGVYRRADGETKAISISQIPGDPTTPLPGTLDGTSRDGRYAFFRSGRLTLDAADANPVNLIPADLYRYDSASEQLTFIGAVGGPTQVQVVGIADDAQTIYYDDGSKTVVWRNGVLHTVTADLLRAFNAFPSASGRFLAYLGNDGDAHLYDADTDQTVCVSCRADGSTGGTASLTWEARNISNRAPQIVTDDGMMFFDTKVPLVSADLNATRDVYSYQDGKVTLISPGDGSFEAQFADATPDGSNVFFITDEGLVGQDTDGAVDVYDARIGGGFSAQSPPPPPASCLRGECAEADSGPLSSPPVGSSSSQSQVKPRKRCAKGTHARKVKGKTRCVKSARAKKKANRANTNRRQGR